MHEIRKIVRETIEEDDWFKRVLNLVRQKTGYKLDKFVGSGTCGAAYELPNNIILKVSTDGKEADAAEDLKEKESEYLADIYKVIVVENETFVILLEKLENLTQSQIYAFNCFWKSYMDFKSLYNTETLPVFLATGYNKDLAELLKQEDKFNKVPGYSTLQIYEDLLMIYNEAKSKGVLVTDIQVDNMGQKNGHLSMFDIS